MLHLFPHKFQYMHFIIKILLIHNIYHGVLTLIRHLSSALVFQNSRPHPRNYLSHPYPCCFLYILVILEQNLDSYHYKKSAHLKIKYPYQISLPIFMFLPSPLPLLFLLLFSPPHFFFWGLFQGLGLLSECSTTELASAPSLFADVCLFVQI